MNKKTTINVYPKDTKRLWSLRRAREYIPERKSGKGRRGRPPSDMETFADLFKRAIDALERERSQNEEIHPNVQRM